MSPDDTSAGRVAPPDPAPVPLQLTPLKLTPLRPAERRPAGRRPPSGRAGHDRRRRGSGHGPNGDRRRAPRPGVRRSSTVHSVVASMLAVLALVGCVTAILLLATQPTATRLSNEIGALDARLAQADRQLAALRQTVGRTAGMGARIQGLEGRLSGLQRTVHGLQSRATVATEQATGLRDCVPQLQQELSGLTLRTRSVAGRVSSVGLNEPTGLSPACQALFAGL